MLFKGRNTVHKQMPFSDARSMDLQDIVSQMIDGYWQVRRKMRQIYLQFDGGVLLLLIQEETILVLLLTSRVDADLAGSAGSVLLNDYATLLAQLSNEASATRNEYGIEELVVTSPRRLQEMTDEAEPVVNNWGQVCRVIEGILGKVLGRAQAANMIDRTLADSGTADPYRLNVSQVRKLAASVIDQIPNTSKRRQLLTELDSKLADMNL